MRDATMMLQVGDTSPKPADGVNVRKVCTDDDGQRGVSRLAVKARLTDGDSGKRVGQIVHAKGVVASGQRKGAAYSAFDFVTPLRYRTRERLGRQ